MISSFSLNQIHVHFSSKGSDFAQFLTFCTNQNFVQESMGVWKSVPQSCQSPHNDNITTAVVILWKLRNFHIWELSAVFCFNGHPLFSLCYDIPHERVMVEWAIAYFIDVFVELSVSLKKIQWHNLDVLNIISTHGHVESQAMNRSIMAPIRKAANQSYTYSFQKTS